MFRRTRGLASEVLITLTNMFDMQTYSIDNLDVVVAIVALAKEM